MAKPTGSACNLGCDYCFYLEKKAYFPGEENFRMSDEVLDAYVRKTIEASGDLPEVLFAWQGGEPTLMPRSFYEKAFALQKRYARGKTIRNSIQTNGILLDDSWCALLKKHDVLVGLSLDGPRDIHDRYRADKVGAPTFAKVLESLHRLQKYEVEYNVLCCVTRDSPDRALEIYEFFRDQGVQYIQFIPIVERRAAEPNQVRGLNLAGPPKNEEFDLDLMPWSVSPEGFGDFLITILNQWVRRDVGSMFVMNFEWTLHSWLYGDSQACVYSRQCGKAVILEHNGDIYACDHFMYPEYLRGNILQEELSTILGTGSQIDFGTAKEETLPSECIECDVRFACHGDCPKHRFTKSIYSENGLSYLCPSYKKYFRYADSIMKGLSKLYRNKLPLSMIMDAIDGPLIIRD